MDIRRHVHKLMLQQLMLGLLILRLLLPPAAPRESLVSFIMADTLSGSQ